MIRPKLLLIGGSNIDFIGTSKAKLISSVSNIGEVNISFGGVMRNITENLARLGNDLTFITAIGNDNFGNKIIENLKSLNVKIIYPKTNLPTSTYLAINDFNHDLAYGICDNRIINKLSITYLKSLKSLINQFDYLILDTNLNEETITYLLETYKDKKIFIDTISPTKALKIKNHLKYIYLLKCNIYEAKSLINKEETDNYKIVKELLNIGAKNIVLTSGSNNIYYGNEKEIDIVNIKKIEKFENTTGCGDALMSGLIDSLITGYSLKDSIIFGDKLSKLTLMSKSATTIEIEKYRH